MAFEINFLDFLQTMHQPILDKIMVFFSTIGNSGLFWIILALVLVCFRKTRCMGICMLASMALGFLTGNLIIKPLVARPRPCWINPEVNMIIAVPTDFSFPSGHTLASFAAATACFINNKKAGIIAGIIAVIIGFSRMYLYVHFPTDVIVGMVMGIGAGIIMSLVVKHFYKKVQVPGSK